MEGTVNIPELKDIEDLGERSDYIRQWIYNFICIPYLINVFHAHIV